MSGGLSGGDLKIGLEVAEFLIVNDYEMNMLTRKTGFTKKEIIRKVKVCIVTLGENSAEIYAQENDWTAQKIKAVEIDKVTDLTGVGDAFRAGFLYGVVREWDLKKSARLGCVVASFVVKKHGTQEHNFAWPENKQPRCKHAGYYALHITIK